MGRRENQRGGVILRNDRVLFFFDVCVARHFPKRNSVVGLAIFGNPTREQGTV